MNALFKLSQFWIPPGFAARLLTKKAQRTNRSNLAQPIDVNTLETLISRATSPCAMAYPLLRFLPHLNARQTSAMLEKLPRLEALHQRRYNSPNWGGDQEQQEAHRVLMASLAERFADVMQHSTATEMQKALWGLAIWSSKNRGSLDNGVNSKIASNLAERLVHLSSIDQLSYPLLSHAAWYLSASGLCSGSEMESVARLIATHGARVSSASKPTSPAHTSNLNLNPKSYSKKLDLIQGRLSYSQRMAGGGEVDLDGSLGREVSLPHPASSSTQMDHRSLLRMAWALGSLGSLRPFEPAWKVGSPHNFITLHLIS